MTDHPEDESHPSSDPPIATRFHLRYLMALALIAPGGIITVVCTIWIAGEVIDLW